MLLSASSWVSAESFVVDNIEVNGIKKITIGTVFSYLPVNGHRAQSRTDTGIVFHWFF